MLNGAALNHSALKTSKGILTPQIQTSNLPSLTPIQNTFDALESIYNLDDDVCILKLSKII